MAVLVLLRALIFVLLVCVSHSYQIKIGPGSDPGSGSSGSGAPVFPGGSGLGLQGVVVPSRPGAQGAPASPSSSAFVGPAVSGYYPASAAVPNEAPATDVSWRVAPPSPEGPSGDRSAAGGGFAPEDSSFFGPPVPEFTAGELSHVEKSFEHGSNDRESEQQGEHPGRRFFSGPVPGLPIGPADGLGANGLPFARFPGPPGYPGHYWFPYYDWMFLTGQYPPGTVSHFSSSFEQGRDNWRDSHYDKHYYPVQPESQSGPVIPIYPHTGKPVVPVGAKA